MSEKTVAYIDPMTKTPIYLGDFVWLDDGREGTVVELDGPDDVHVWVNGQRLCRNLDSVLLINPKAESWPMANWYQDDDVVPVRIRGIDQDSGTWFARVDQVGLRSVPSVLVPLRKMRPLGKAFYEGQQVALDRSKEEIKGAQHDLWPDDPALFVIDLVDPHDALATYYVYPDGQKGMSRWVPEKWLTLPDTTHEEAKEDAHEEAKEDVHRIVQEGDIYQVNERVLLITAIPTSTDSGMSGRGRVSYLFQGPVAEIGNQLPVEQFTYFVNAEDGGWQYLSTMTTPDLMEFTRDLLYRMSTAPNELERRIASMEQDVRHAREAARRAEEKWESLGQRAMELADEKGYCREYDEMAEELGLPTRERDWSVVVDVTVRMSLGVLAHDEDSAGEAAEEQAKEALQGHFISNLGVHLDVESVEIIDTNAE